MEIRFHLDENVNGAVANGLQLRGVDVTTSRDANLIGATDEAQLAFARNNDRVLVTHDDDLLTLASLGVSHAGIAYCHPRKNSVGQNVIALFHLWRTTPTSEMHDHIVFL